MPVRGPVGPTRLEKRVAYLAAWCSSQTRWLRRLLETGRNEPVYQLTPHTEEVFAFLDRVLEQDFGFVGTESRLRLVMESLADLVVSASEDPEARLGHLGAEMASLRWRAFRHVRRLLVRLVPVLLDAPQDDVCDQDDL